jgi:D-amino-acid dehydrogenase
VKVAVVGGGVIGLACAWYLRRGGADTIVVERDHVGEAASLGNAGWITPGLSNPIAAPGAVRQALRWMLDPESPFLLRPRLDPELASWCLRFWRSASRQRYLAGMRALLTLNRHTLELFDGLAADGVRFEMHAQGMLFLFRTQQALDEEATVLEELRREGYAGEVRVLTPAEAQSLEPAVADALAGALHVPAERHVRPETLTAGLAASLRAAGAEVVEHAEVTALSRGDGRWQVATAAGDIEADRVVVAAGVWTARVLAPLRVRIRQQAAKGYSVTATGAGTPPRHPLYLGEARVGCSPFDDGVRLAGTLELAGLDLSFNRRRLNAVARASADYLADWRPERTTLEWAGLRPLPPDGLPLIGPVSEHPGLFVATGHGMLGITLAPATGAALAPCVIEGREMPELAPFAVGR